MRAKRLLPDLSIAAALAAANLPILGPYLRTEFSDQPWNNGQIYMAIARLFRDRPWTWNPLQYCGAPFHYLYPPVFHVLLAAMPSMSLGRAFHLLTGIAYALAPACLYVLAFTLFRSRFLAVFAAILYTAFPSPVYSLLPQWRLLAHPYAGAPWGFVALVGYEEAGHAFALPLTLLAAAAAWRSRWLWASLAAAAVVLINWPALIGLGFPLAAIAIVRARDLGAVKSAAQTGAAVGVAYGLAAFWMTPGYFLSSTLLNRIVLRHAPLAATPWSWITWLILLAAAGAIGLALWRRVPPPLALALAWVALAGAVVAAFTLAGNALVPSPNRAMLELNAGAVLLVAGLISLAAPRWRAALAIVAMVAGSGAAFGFLSHAWTVEPHPQDPREGVAYQVAAWLNGHAGASRVFASGELDGSLALWSDVPQAGGTGQDISNFLIFAAERQVAFGCSADSERVAEAWLRALNVRYFVVHGAASREYFHWYAQAEKFGALPVAWENGAGDTIYRVPDSGGSDAVVVDLAAMSRLPRLRSTGDERFLRAYADWAAAKRPAAIRWNRADDAEIDAALEPGEAILVKTNYDAGWRVANGSAAGDPIGFLLIRGAPGRQHLRLRFGASWDVWLGRAITGLTIVLLLARVRMTRIAAAAVIPSLAAYAILLSNVPPAAAVAEDAFVRIRPPIISPGGIVDQPGGVVSVYGLDFGAKSDTVRVWLGGRQAEVLYHSANLINFKLPPGAPARAEIGVEVNGCRGNAFTMPAERTQ